MVYRRILFLIFFIASLRVEARVFSFGDESLGAFFSGGYGDASLIGSNAFANSSGAATEFSSSDVVPYTQMLEFGFVTSIKDKVTMKVGAQLVQAKEVEAEGDNSGGTKLLDVTSDLFVFNPNVSFEFKLSGDNTSKWFAKAGAGWGQMSFDNTYVLTAAGQAAYSGVSANFVEKAESTFITYDLGVGYEVLAVDATTFVFDFGYRFMEGLKLTYKGDGENLAESDFAHSKGDTVKNNGGSDNRQLNMGGFYFSIGFRFYIDLG